MASKRTKIVVGIVAGLTLAGVVAASVTRDIRRRVSVQTQKVERRDLVSLVSASGEVRPKRFVNVSSDVSGRIVRLQVKEGDRVKAGQTLARIDSTRFEADTKQAQAGLEATRAELARAQADLEVSRLAFDRTQRMRAEQLVSEQEFDQAEAEFKMKTAGVEALRRRIAQQDAVLESSRDLLVKSTVASPMDGVVTSLQKEEGETVIGAQSFQPTVIMTVADLSVMEVEILVDETDIRSVALGQPAEVRVDALQDLKIMGEVTEIGASAVPRGATVAGQTTSSGSTANQAKDFKVTVTLADPPASLRPGLNATADITTARKSGVLAAPIQAVVVRELDEKGKVIDPDAAPEEEEGTPSALNIPRAKGVEREGVFVVAGKQARFKPVKTGIVGETEIEIVEGLAEGEQIVSGSYKTLRTLKDEARIKIEEKKEG
jgi:HlyD family secretion protein